MTDKAKKYLSDILLAIKLVEEFTQGIDSFFEYEADAKTRSAVEHQLAIIGEAVNKFEKEQTTFVLTSSRQIIDFRNRLIHSYDNIDNTIVWVALKKHLPILKQEAIQGLEKLNIQK